MKLSPKPLAAMLTRLPSRPLAGLPLLALLLVGLGGPQTLAQPVGSPPKAQRLTPEQQQKLFPDQRRLALSDRRARIAILERGQSCVQSAANPEALRNCMRTERQAMREQRRQHMDDVQALFERNGLPAPQWKQRQGRPQAPMPNGANSEI